MNWLYLVIAGVFEIAFTFCLSKITKADKSELLFGYCGFILSSIISLALLAKATQTLPVGTAYAIWTGIGAFGSVIIGIKKENALNLNLLGLTSKKNIEFVRQLGWYDQAISYDSIAQLNSKEKFVEIDFAGNHNTQFQLQTLLNKNLVYNCLVGLVDWQNLEGENPLPKKGELFFAPVHAQKRQKEWGLSGFQQKIGVAWQQFMDAIQPTISIKEHIGGQELEKLYSDMLNGKIDPKYATS